MASVRRGCAFWAIVFLGNTGAAAFGQVLPPDLWRQWQELQRQERQIQQQHQEKEEALRRLSQRITHLKAGKIGVVGQYRLESSLAQAAALAEELAVLQQRSLRFARQAEKLRGEAGRELDQEMDQLARRILSHTVGRQEAVALGEELQQKIIRRHQLNGEPSPATASSFWPGFDRQSDDRQSLAQKVGYYKEQEQRLRRELESAREQFSQWQKRLTLAREVRHFLEEESFFNETEITQAPGNGTGKGKGGTEALLAAKGNPLAAGVSPPASAAGDGAAASHPAPGGTAMAGTEVSRSPGTSSPAAGGAADPPTAGATPSSPSSGNDSRLAAREPSVKIAMPSAAPLENKEWPGRSLDTGKPPSPQAHAWPAPREEHLAAQQRIADLEKELAQLQVKLTKLLSEAKACGFTWPKGED